jgi:hypothetical protein
MNATTAAKIIIPKVVQYVREDLDDVYELLQDWQLPRLRFDVPNLDCEAFTIRDNVITVKAFGGFTNGVVNCDGCTLAPEKAIIKTTIGAVFHDRWYMFLEYIAKAWGWTVRMVRKLGDLIFANILLLLARMHSGIKRAGAVVVANVYYAGVVAFGGFAHMVYKVFALALVCGVCSGCAGCINECFEGETITTPNYRQIGGAE